MIQIDVELPRLFAEGASELSVQLALVSGTLTALVGPSGSGKTTLLRLVAGLETPKQGRIVVDGVVWLDCRQRINRKPQQRSVGYVFQDTALFPNMTVEENIRYAAPTGMQPLLDKLVAETGLMTFLNQNPLRLSGGQRQRVALVRALIRRPRLLLLDEPFAALDVQASQALREVVRELHQEWGTTTLLVSHHEADVQALADRVVRLEQGRIESDVLTNKSTMTTHPSEQITRIDYDETQQRWVIETNTTQIQSSNPGWAQRRVGDWLQIGNS